tara:strand:+ start:4524 stop:5663 length:1140 start_codon:yes stop_codon:yes gene_type:complete
MFTSRRIATSGGGDKFRDEFSVAFDGTNDYVELGGAFNYNVHSISAWIKVNADTTSKAIFDYRDANNDGIYLAIDDVERISYQINNADGLYTTPLTADVWYHIVATNDGSTSTIYLNGVSVETADTSSETVNIAGTYPPRIGARSHSSPNNYFNGNISEVAIYNSALTANQVKTIYNGREPYNHKEGVASGNLKAWYRMGDGDLDRTTYTSNENNGLISNMAIPSSTAQTANLITNGSFAGDLTGWTILNASGDNNVTYSSGTARFLYDDAISTAALGLKQASVTTPGKTYKIIFTIAQAGGTSGTLKFYNGSTEEWVSLGSGAHTLYFIAQGTYIAFYRNVSNVDVDLTLDNVSMYEVTGTPGLLVNMTRDDYEGDTP